MEKNNQIKSLEYFLSQSEDNILKLIKAFRVAEECVRYCCYDDAFSINEKRECDQVVANEWKKMVSITAYNKIREILNTE